MVDAPKHLQLGVTLDPADDRDPEVETDRAAIDAAWADATTVEQYKADIEALAAKDSR